MDPAAARLLDDTCATGGLCTDFFSRTSIDSLQQRIVPGVRDKHNCCIERQSEQQLLLLMRSVWMRHGETLAVGAAADAVVAEAVKIIKVNIDMHETATRFLYENPEPLPLPQNTSTQGTKLGY